MCKLKYFICFCLSIIIISELTAQDSAKPNIIFILTDDHRYDMLGCTGHDIVQTPHIDELASDGVLFTNAYVTSAICTPSRISIFLSQFERKHGVNFNSGTSVSDEAWEKSYPQLLKQAGYYTGYIGKNHAPVGKGGYNSGVMESSFDYWYAGHGHLSFYPKQRHDIFKKAAYDTQVEIINEGANDFFSNEQKLNGATEFLDNRPENQPFCLSLAFNLPHGAGTSSMQLRDTDPEIYRTLYRDQEIEVSKHYIPKSEIKNAKLPKDIHFVEERQPSYLYVNEIDDTKERLTRSYQAVTGIDRLIGNLRQTLKEKGLDQNTIIIFASDHGLFFGEFGLGGKALCYQIVTHIPMIIYNPMAPSQAKGKVYDEFVQTIDIAPTILDYAGITIPGSFQGKSLNKIVNGQNLPVRDYIYTENLWSNHFGNPRCESVQNKDWKYIRYYENNNLRASVKIEAAKLFGISQKQMLYTQYDPHIPNYRNYVESPLRGELPVFEELFNMKKDPDETKNLASKRRYKKQLKKMREVWREQIKMARGDGPPSVLPYTADVIEN